MKLETINQPRLSRLHPEALHLSRQALVEVVQDVLSRGLPVRFCAGGWSMAPFIRDRDVITISPLSGKHPSIGEVVAFVRNPENRLVVHRVVGRRESTYIMQGDSNLDCLDEEVHLENILGRISEIKRDNHLVRLGLGPERKLVAWLSQRRWLVPLKQMITEIFSYKGQRN